MRHFTPKLSGSTTVSGSFTSDTHLIPEVNGVYDIGSASMGWRNLYGTASVATSASYADVAMSSSFATSASYATTVDYDNIVNIPSGIVSSSEQVTDGSGIFSSSAQLPGGIISSSTQIVSSLPTGTLSSSAQIASDISGALSSVAIAELGANILSGSITTSSITNFDTHVSSAAASAGFGTGGGGGSYTLTNTDIAGLGVGIISGSSQLPDGTVSSSVQIDYTNITNVPEGIVSSSTQIKASLPSSTLSSSAQIASDISGAFNGVTSSFLTAADTASFLTSDETGSFVSASLIANVTESAAPYIQMWVGTSASYAAIGTKDDNTLYFLT